jgi:membrane associated rhomboid family serine protease
LSFGGRVPWGVGLVLAITVVMSLLVAFGDRHAGSLFQLTSLIPEAVWRGQVWRLATWSFVEPSPIGLIFACLFLYWFGGELGREWGSRRFLAVYAGIALTASILTCLIARVDQAVAGFPYLGTWSIGAAFAVAWGLWFPDRVIRIWFVLPIRGFILAWATIAITVVFAIYRGWEHYLPELCAEGAMVAWLFRRSVATRFAKVQRSVQASREASKREAATRERAKKRAASAAYLRVVESHDSDPPELPPEVDTKLDELLKGRAKRDRKDDN